jgi:hypothetical protein
MHGPVTRHHRGDGHTYLGCGQPDSRRGFHGGPPLRDEPPQLAGAQVAGADRFGRAAQDRVTGFDMGSTPGSLTAA